MNETIIDKGWLKAVAQKHRENSISAIIAMHHALILADTKIEEMRENDEQWRMMKRGYIGGYEKGPNPSWLCRHRHRLSDCITCLNEHLEYEARHK